MKAVSLRLIFLNRYGIGWVYRSATDDARLHVVYGQGNYTLTQAIEESPPSSLPAIVNSLGVILAKIVFQEGATDFYEIYYPWATQFSSTGASDHGGLAGLGDDDHTQYILDAGTVTDDSVPAFNGTDGRTTQPTLVTIDDDDNVYIPGQVGIGTAVDTDNLITGAWTTAVTTDHTYGIIVNHNSATVSANQHIASAFNTNFRSYNRNNSFRSRISWWCEFD